MALRFIPIEEAERVAARQPEPEGPVRQGGSVSLLHGSSVTPEPINWLWNGYLAKGKLHLFAGKPSAGKTTVVLDLAARISRGGTFPDHTRAVAGNILIWSGEDGIEDTLVPRLLGAGADMTRVFFVGQRQEGNEARAFDPSRDMPLLVEAARHAGGVSLLILDPIVSAVAGDSHKNAEVRRGLQPIVDFATETGAAVIGITHLSKGTTGGDPIDRITGSLAFGAVTRIAFLVAREEAGEEGSGRRVMTRAKSNIGPDGGGFYYDIKPAPLPDNPAVVTSKVEWLGVAEGTARDIIGNVETTHDGEAKSALEEACEFLLTELHDGPVPAKTVQKNAREATISLQTLRRARKKVGVKTEKIGFENGWVWYLPGRPKVPNSGEDAQGAHTPGDGHLRDSWAPSAAEDDAEEEM